MDRYAVVGHPVSHSRSPRIHALFAEATGQILEYGLLPADLDQFESAVSQFRAEGGKGLNVTLPFKERAFALATSASSRAKAAGAANTLHFKNGDIFADNTDGAGLVRDLTCNLSKNLEGTRILLIGAGGAARGVVQPLLAEHPALLVIANRTPGRAHALREALSESGAIPPEWLDRCKACGFDAIPEGDYDLVINATSSSLSHEAPAIPERVYGPRTLAYDMVYGKGITPFLEIALASGAGRVADGLGMLVEQAAESFLLWRGVRPETASVLQRLRKEMA
jgi:shikimate dehydrogenase